MSFEYFCNDHIGKRGEVKNAGWAEEDCRVTKFVRFGNWNIRLIDELRTHSDGGVRSAETL